MTDPIENADVISAFLDNEPFDPVALARALAEPCGRDALIDFIALRHVVNEEAALEPKSSAAPPRSRWRGLVAAAAVITALAGGYAVGRGQTGSESTSDDISAPQPTRVVELRPGVEWQTVTGR